MYRGFSRFCLRLGLSVLLPGGGTWASGEDLIVRTPKPYTTIKQKIALLGGSVYFVVDPDTASVRVTLRKIVPSLQPAQQNQLFGDDVLFAVHSAKTSAIGQGDYLALEFLALDRTFSRSTAVPDEGDTRTEDASREGAAPSSYFVAAATRAAAVVGPFTKVSVWDDRRSRNSRAAGKPVLSPLDIACSSTFRSCSGVVIGQITR